MGLVCRRLRPRSALLRPITLRATHSCTQTYPKLTPKRTRPGTRRRDQHVPARVPTSATRMYPLMSRRRSETNTTSAANSYPLVYPTTPRNQHACRLQRVPTGTPDLTRLGPRTRTYFHTRAHSIGTATLVPMHVPNGANFQIQNSYPLAYLISIQI